MIISLLSPYFKKMLCGEFADSKLTQICIKDVEIDIFKIILTYIYSGNISFSFGKLISLIRAADIYDIDGLKSKIENCCKNYLENCEINENIFNFVKLRRLQIYSLNHIQVIWKKYI